MDKINMTSVSLIQQVVNDILSKMHYESKHGHLIRCNDGNMNNDKDHNLEYISIDDFFNDKNNIEKTDWKWGLKKDEIEFVNEYWEYFNYRKMVSKYV